MLTLSQNQSLKITEPVTESFPLLRLCGHMTSVILYLCSKFIRYNRRIIGIYSILALPNNVLMCPRNDVVPRGEADPRPPHDDHVLLLRPARPRPRPALCTRPRRGAARQREHRGRAQREAADPEDVQPLARVRGPRHGEADAAPHPDLAGDRDGEAHLVEVSTKFRCSFHNIQIRWLLVP